jgi:signal transduction histidine kinase
MLSIKKAFLISVGSIILVFSMIILSWTYIYQKDALLNAVLVIILSTITVVPLLYFLSYLINQDIDKLTKNIKLDSFENNFKMEEFHKINNHFKELSKNLHKSNKKKEILIKRLKSINESKNEIISAISHEFKNPISIMSGYVQTILENDLDREVEKKFLLKIEKNGLKLSSLIDRLYLIAKLENEKIKLRKTSQTLFEVVNSSIEQIENKRIKTNFIEDIEIECDKNLIEIVITNLINNALKYSKDEVTIEISNKTINVIDKGLGISEENLEHIKDKFYRVSKNDWDNSLGLGLAIVEKILKLHNSHLKIESEIGIGSKFSFSFS